MIAPGLIPMQGLDTSTPDWVLAEQAKSLWKRGLGRAVIVEVTD